MNSHPTIQAWAPLIRNALLTKRMPPGQTDPYIGNALVDDRHLSSDQLQSLVHWIDAGAVNDSDADPLTALEPPSVKWPLGEPDVVIQIPPQDIPATGHLGLIWVDTGYVFEKDTWLKGATTVPGGRSVVHHTAARVVPPGVEPSMGDGGSSMPNWGPGMNERFLGEGTGLFIPKGQRLFLNMHYTPNGTATVDVTEYGMYFYEDGFEPTHEIILDGVVLRGGFEVPPHDENHDIIRTSPPTTQDSYAVTFLPHMHYRGKRVKWTAQYPDGTEELLFSVANVDFNWQALLRSGGA